MNRTDDREHERDSARKAGKLARNEKEELKTAKKNMFAVTENRKRKKRAKKQRPKETEVAAHGPGSERCVGEPSRRCGRGIGTQAGEQVGVPRVVG